MLNAIARFDHNEGPILRLRLSIDYALFRVSCNAVLLVAIHALPVKYRSPITATQQSICDGASALIANVSHEKLLGQRSVRVRRR